MLQPCSALLWEQDAHRHLELLPGSLGLFSHGERGIQWVAGPSSELCFMQTLLTECSERDPKVQVPSGGLNIPVGASLHWIQPLPAARGFLLTPGGPPFISQEQGQEKGCKLRDLRPCDISVLLLQAPTLHMAGVK